VRLSINVGELPSHDMVNLRRCEDGSINIIVYNRLYKATYQRTQNGNFLISSTYPKERYTEMAQALESIETEIERRCIELSEAELRIDYKPVLIDEGQKITVGQSNSLMIYIVVESYDHRALFHFDGKKVKYIKSSYPPEEGSKISTLIQRNFDKIYEVMEEYNMVEPRKVLNQKKRKNKLYNEGFASTMTESGREERQKIDSLIENIFQELDEKEYSNLEIQSMLMESVFEIALQYRRKNKMYY